MRFLTFLFLCALVTASAQAPQQQNNSGNMTRLHIDSGVLYTRSGIPIHLSRADARIAPGLHATGSDGKTSANGNDNKVVFLDSGRVGLSDASLTKLMQSKIQGKGIEDLKLTTDHGRIKISGKMKKVISIPITIEGPADATPDGKIALHTKTEKASFLPIKGLADALGMSVNKIVGSNSKGVKADGDNALIFDPDDLWGLPIHGSVTRVLVEKNGLVLIFGRSLRASGRQFASSK